MEFKLSPKEQAEELIQSMYNFIPLKTVDGKSEMLAAKYCARVACHEIKAQLCDISEEIGDVVQVIKYWDQVLDETDRFGVKKHGKVATQIRFAMMVKEYVSIPRIRFLKRKKSWDRINAFAKEHSNCCEIKW